MKRDFGLTLVELLVVVSLLGIFLSLGTIIFTNFARQDEIEATAKKVVAVFSEAQAKTLAGFSHGGSSGLNFGVYFDEESYTLFSGTVFDHLDPNNQEFNLSSRLSFSEILFPSGSIVFEKISGEVRDFNLAQNLIVLSDQRSGQAKTIRINKLGVVTVE